ncbi:MAG: hypothetical protein QNJ82_14065 [Gammaproteobacteria bacterium]|nr:hypothetical protein [Gammaproteobacteria bacterium]
MPKTDDTGAQRKDSENEQLRLDDAEALSEPTELKPLNVLGWFHVERKGDFIAVVALLISIVNAVIALKWLSQDSLPTLLPPSTITLYSFTEQIDENAVDLMGLIAPMTYVNTGDAGQSTVVTRESVTFSLPGIEGTVRQLGYELPVVRDVRNELRFYAFGATPWLPFSVLGGTVKSHNTAFAPPTEITSEGGDIQYKQKYLPRRDDLFTSLRQTLAGKHIDAQVDSKGDRGLDPTAAIKLSFHAYVKDRKTPLSTSCSIFVNATLLQRFKADKAKHFPVLFIDSNTERVGMSPPENELPSLIGAGWTVFTCFPEQD